VVNLSYTAATPASLFELIGACPDIEILKVTQTRNLVRGECPSQQVCTGLMSRLAHQRDAIVAKFIPKMVEEASEKGFIPLAKLKKLNVSQTELTDSSLAALLEGCQSTLTSVNVSFTPIRRFTALAPIASPPPLEKLNLTAVAIGEADLLALLSVLPHMKKLILGALGGQGGLTLTDDVLVKVTAILGGLQQLEEISLVGNAKLGRGSKAALAEFVSNVGRKCKVRINSILPL
jgi:hypothetical protein